MLSKALQKRVIPWLLGVVTVLLVAGTALGSAIVDFRPMATPGLAVAGQSGAGSYQLPPTIGAVTVTVSGFGSVPSGEASGQFLYVRLSIANNGDQAFTVMPATSTLTDDLGNRVTGGALFSGQTRLTSGTVGPGSRDEFQLGFALPPDSSISAIGGVAVQWAYQYGNRSYVAQTQLAKDTGNVYPSPGQSAGYGNTISPYVGYDDAGYGYSSPSYFYLDSYPDWGAYPWWSWSGFGFGPWWDSDLFFDSDFGHHHRFFDHGAFFGRGFDRDDFGRGFVRGDRAGFSARGGVVPSDRLAASVNGRVLRNGLTTGGVAAANTLNTRNLTTLRSGTTAAGVATAPRVLNAPNSGWKAIGSTPGTVAPYNRTFTAPAPARTFSSAPSVRTFSAPAARTFSAPAPARTFSAPAPARTFSAPAARTFSAPAPARTFSAPAPARSFSAPARSFSAPAPARTFSAPARSFSAPAAAPHFSGGGGGGGHGGGRR